MDPEYRAGYRTGTGGWIRLLAEEETGELILSSVHWGGCSGDGSLDRFFPTQTGQHFGGTELPVSWKWMFNAQAEGMVKKTSGYSGVRVLVRI